MPFYPGDPQPMLRCRTTIAESGCTDHELHTTMHIGTHIDAPLHMVQGGKYLSEIPPEQGIGRGWVVDARGQSILGAHLISDMPSDVKILLFCTGHGPLFGTPGYYDQYPVLSQELARAIAASNIRVIGLDTPSPDMPPHAVHKLLLSQEILIMENLANLESLLGVPRFTVIALAPKLRADAGPVRVVAVID